MKGLYIHIPFCATKCEYCDFYSLKYNTKTVENYTNEMCRRLNSVDEVFDTVYFGGGTPSVIGADRLNKILGCVKFNPKAEITVEINPRTIKNDFFEKLNKSFNRISIGLQSADENELKFLTRNHNLSDVKYVIEKARTNGFNNISLDVMIGLENQTETKLKKTLDFCISCDIEHISCYMLKIEENTPFYNKKLVLPDDDIVSDMYLFMCEYLEKNNFYQYEISNFSKKGFESRHNLIYWNSDDYLGLGPSAHSFIGGKRYYFPNDINYFLSGNEFVFGENGGDCAEYIMLKLRLNSGFRFDELNKRGYNVSKEFLKKAKVFEKSGFLVYDEKGIRLTRKGFLVQNSVLGELLEEL